jgi:2-C-methyl-D-erythritol 4-phosphate cytidylyltransferase
MFDLGYKCKIIKGHEDNYKITTMKDFQRSQAIIED